MQPTAKPRVTAGTRSFILVTAFLNLAGIGIIIPVTPYIVRQYTSPDSTAFAASLLFTVYSLCVFLAVPTLGALSDRFGRRPVLLISLFGSAIGYLLFGIGGSLAMLFLGRIIDGLTGGNIATIFAYAADITEPQERTKFFGLIGAVSGLAFVLGPAVGGLVYGITRQYSAPLYFSFVVYLLNTIWGYFAMPESLSLDRRSAIEIRKLNPLTQLLNAFNIVQLRYLFGAIFMWTLAFALLQSNLSILTEDKLKWSPDGTSALLAYIGIIGVGMQLAIIPRALKRYKEGRLASGGMFIMGAGFTVYAIAVFFVFVPLIFVAATLVAIGNGFIIPTTNGLISQAVSPREQGRVQGSNQAVQALARVLAPLWGGISYSLSAAIPYATGAVCVIIGGLFVIAALPALQRAAEQMQAQRAAMGGARPEAAPVPGGH